MISAFIEVNKENLKLKVKLEEIELHQVPCILYSIHFIQYKFVQAFIGFGNEVNAMQ